METQRQCSNIKDDALDSLFKIYTISGNEILPSAPIKTSTFNEDVAFYYHEPDNYATNEPLDVFIYYNSQSGGVYPSRMGILGIETYPYVEYVQNNPDSLVILDKDSNPKGEILANYLHSLQEKGITIKPVNLFSHSKSLNDSIRDAITLYNNDIPVALTVSMDSTATCASLCYNRSDVDGGCLSKDEIVAFAETGSMLVLFEEKGTLSGAKTNLETFIMQAKELGATKQVPIMLVNCDITYVENFNRLHLGINDLPILNGFLDVIKGKREHIGLAEPKDFADYLTKVENAIYEYKYEMYNYETNKWEEYSEEEAAKILASYGLSLSEYTNNFLCPDLTINSNLVAALGAAGATTILNNLELVESHMNDIRGVIRDIPPTPTTDFNSTVLVIIKNYITEYNIFNKLFMNTLSAETAGILSNAEGIAAMDEDLEDLVARQLSDDYHGTNLVGEAGKDINSVEETTSVPSISVDVPKEIEDLYDSLEGENDGEKLHDYLAKRGFNEQGRLALAGYSSGCLYSDIFKEYCEEHGYSNDIYGQLQFLEDKFNEGAFNNSGTMQNNKADTVGVQFASKILGIKDSATQIEMAKIANQGYLDGKANLN